MHPSLSSLYRTHRFLGAGTPHFFLDKPFLEQLPQSPLTIMLNKIHISAALFVVLSLQRTFIKIPRGKCYVGLILRKQRSSPTPLTSKWDRTASKRTGRRLLTQQTSVSYFYLISNQPVIINCHSFSQPKDQEYASRTERS